MQPIIVKEKLIILLNSLYETLASVQVSFFLSAYVSPQFFSKQFSSYHSPSPQTWGCILKVKQILSDVDKNLSAEVFFLMQINAQALYTGRKYCNNLF